MSSESFQLQAAFLPLSTSPPTHLPIQSPESNVPPGNLSKSTAKPNADSHTNLTLARFPGSPLSAISPRTLCPSLPQPNNSHRNHPSSIVCSVGPELNRIWSNSIILLGEIILGDKGSYSYYYRKLKSADKIGSKL
jgi:hypothetical protein